MFALGGSVFPKKPLSGEVAEQAVSNRQLQTIAKGRMRGRYHAPDVEATGGGKEQSRQERKNPPPWIGREIRGQSPFSCTTENGLCPRISRPIQGGVFLLLT